MKSVERERLAGENLLVINGETHAFHVVPEQLSLKIGSSREEKSVLLLMKTLD